LYILEKLILSISPTINLYNIHSSSTGFCISCHPHIPSSGISSTFRILARIRDLNSSWQTEPASSFLEHEQTNEGKNFAHRTRSGALFPASGATSWFLFFEEDSSLGKWGMGPGVGELDERKRRNGRF